MNTTNISNQWDLILWVYPVIYCCVCSWSITVYCLQGVSNGFLTLKVTETGFSVIPLIGGMWGREKDKVEIKLTSRNGNKSHTLTSRTMARLWSHSSYVSTTLLRSLTLIWSLTNWFTESDWNQSKGMLHQTHWSHRWHRYGRGNHVNSGQNKKTIPPSYTRWHLLYNLSHSLWILRRDLSQIPR